MLKNKLKTVYPLLENLLKIETNDHREIQEQIRKNLRSLGYYVKLEKKVWIFGDFFIKRKKV